MALTPEELEAIRIADEEIETEWVEEAAEREINAAVDKWLDEMAVMELMDNSQRSKFVYQREYYEAHRDEIAAYKREYRKGQRRRKAKEAAGDAKKKAAGRVAARRGGKR